MSAPRWPALTLALAEEVQGAAGITALIGTPPDDQYVMVGELDYRDFLASGNSMIDWQLIADSDRFEVFEGMLVQFGIFTRSEADMITLETELRALFDHDTPVTLGTSAPVWAWSERISGGPLQGPDDGLLKRYQDYRFTLYKSAYCS